VIDSVGTIMWSDRPVFSFKQPTNVWLFHLKEQYIK